MIEVPKRPKDWRYGCKSIESKLAISAAYYNKPIGKVAAS